LAFFGKSVTKVQPSKRIKHAFNVIFIDFLVNSAILGSELKMKPADLILRSISPTIINSYVIEKIEIDLKHVNYGLDPEKGYGRKARSSFEAEDIIRFFESLSGLEVGF
jgi:hypothetical protein